MPESKDFPEISSLNTEEELTFLSKLQNTIHIGVAVADAQGRLMHVNQGLCRMLELSQDDILGKDFTHMVAPTDELSPGQLDPMTGLQDVVLKFHPAQGDSKNKEVAPRWLEVSSQPLELFAGVPCCILTVIDITQRRHLEEEQRQQDAARYRKDKADSLRQLASAVAHRFNNLLTSILGYTDLARSMLPPHSRVDAMLHEVQSAGRSAAALTQQMLAFTGKGRFVIGPVNLSALAQGVLAELKTTLPDKATLKAELAPQLPDIEADADQMRQLVVNLVANAAEAVAVGDGTITLRTGIFQADTAAPGETGWQPVEPVGESRPGKGQFVFLEVSDTGDGIPADMLGKIFDPFFSTKFPGRGMGLAAVLGIVQGHQGFIHVASEPGQGSTFQIYFPAWPAGQAPAIDHSLHEKTTADAPTILLVEDEVSVALLVKKVLESEGIAVLHAKDGEEAHQLFQQHASTIQAMLVNLALPRTNGLQVVADLKKLNPQIPFAIVTGHSLDEIQDRFPSMQEIDILPKPFTPAALTALMKRLLRAGQ